MNSIYLSFDGVGAAGWEAYPKTGLNADLNVDVLKSHYNNRNIFGDLDEVFLIEMAQVPGKGPLVYYQYLRYKGVKDSAGRTPSVFGVTIATDTLCPDYGMMLSLCRDVFNKCVVGGNLLALAADKSITWVCGSLSSDQAVSVHKNAEEKLVRILIAYQENGLLTDMPVSGWTVSPALSLNNEAQLLVKMNPSDVNGPELASLLKRGQKVAIADSYPPKSTRKAIEEANSARQAAERNVASLSASLSKERNEVTRLNSEKSELSKELSDSSKLAGTLKSEIDALKQEHRTMVSKYEAKGNYSCQQQLKVLGEKLDMLMQSSSKSPSFGNKPKKGAQHKMLMAGAMMILLCALFFCLGLYVSKNNKDSKDETEKKEQVEKNKEQKDDFLESSESNARSEYEKYKNQIGNTESEASGTNREENHDDNNSINGVDNSDEGFGTSGKNTLENRGREQKGKGPDL